MTSSWSGKAIALIATLAIWHLVVGALVGLGDAEALYFCYGLHLQGGYLDHPPMIGWMIATSTWISGDSPMSVRLVPTICHALTLWGAFVLARECYGTSRAGFLSALSMALIPMMTVGGMAAAPDGPASTCWMWTCIVLGRVLRTVRQESRSPAWWEAVLVGSLIGAAFLSKYTGFLLVPSAVMALSHREHRALLWSRWTCLAAVACLLVVSPVIAWNHGNGWVSLLHRLVWTQSGASLGPSLTTLGATLGGQLLYLGPPMALAMTWAMLGLVRRRSDAEHFFLLSFAAPTLALTLTLCLLSPAAEPHWTAQGYLTLTVGLGGLLPRRTSEWRAGIKATLWSAVALLGAALLLLHGAVFTTALADLLGPDRYEPRYDLTNELHGWPGVVDDALGMRHPDEPLAGSHYTICSQLRFALARAGRRDSPRVLCLSEEVDDFDLWGDGGAEAEASVLYLEDDRFGVPASEVFTPSRWELTEVGVSDVTRGRWVVRRFRMVRATRME